MITELRLTNYRCFKDHTIPLRDLSVIIGKNNAGKSTIIEAFRVVSIALRKLTSTSPGFRVPPRKLEIPGNPLGVSLSMKPIGFNFTSVVYRYGNPPAILTATFESGEVLKVFLDDRDTAFAFLTSKSRRRISNKNQLSLTTLPTLLTLPQIAPLESEETILTTDYVAQNIESTRTSRHFRNQLRLYFELFPSFKELAESSWPKLRIRELGGAKGMYKDQLALLVEHDGFTSEVGWMGHGMQIWLQTMWFLTRASEVDAVVLDEPDVYLHAELQRNLIRLLKARAGQKIIATHSFEIISEVDPSAIVIIEKRHDSSKFASDIGAIQTILNDIGSPNNFQFTKLWNSRRCLLVEGDDVTILKILYNTLFPQETNGFNEIPNFPIGGWSAWPYAIGSKMLLENSGGEAITVYCILDSDYHLDEEIDRLKNDARGKGVQLHVWSRKELENYLLSPSAIHRIILREAKQGRAMLELKTVSKKIEEICGHFENHVFDGYASQAKSVDRSLDAKSFNGAARQMMKRRWTTLEDRLMIVPGKEFISALSRWTSTTYKVNMSASKLAREMRVEEIPGEMAAVLQSVREGARFGE